MKKLQSGQRLDYALSQILSNYSRSQIKNWIISKKVKVNHKIVVIPRKKIIGGELIEIDRPKCYDNVCMCPQDISINVIYEDYDILVINKESDMVVHPGAGNNSGTILNALLYKYPFIIQVTRAGIVQRLDKDTSGLMVIAKNVRSYNNLLRLFKEKKIIREYEAVVYGKLVNNSIGIIDKPIRRHAVDRTCMAVHPLGKPAITHYFVTEKFNFCSRVRLRLDTGRTHQIRVHMAYINKPLIGDKKYGVPNVSYINGISDNELRNFLCVFKRQALHACMLQLCHPVTNELMKWNIPLPQDIMHLINILRKKDYCYRNINFE